jgi:hypothetical protein
MLPVEMMHHNLYFQNPNIWDYHYQGQMHFAVHSIHYFDSHHNSHFVVRMIYIVADLVEFANKFKM